MRHLNRLSNPVTSERQSLLIVRNILRLENLGGDAVAVIRPLLAQIFNQLSDAIANDLPRENMHRELRWRSMRLQVASMFDMPSRVLYRKLLETMAGERQNQIDWAESYTQDLENIARAPRDAVALSIAGEPFPIEGVPPQITRTQVARAAREPQVLGRRLGELFEVQNETPEIFPPFVRANLNRINDTIARGFLLGETNEEIARNLRTTGLASSVRESQTLARTAVMQMADDAHNDFWDANRSVIAGWEYDATMDYRTCMICSPWDGRTAVKRSDLPSLKRHPNCRCSILPLTETELLLRKERGPQRRTMVDLREVTPEEKAALKDAAAEKDPKRRQERRDKIRERVGATVKNEREGIEAARVYAQTVRIDGKDYWKVAQDVRQPNRPLTHGEFMQRATDTSREYALGKGRAKKFDLLLKEKVKPDDALMRVTQPFYKETTETRPSLRRKVAALPALGESRPAVQIVDGRVVQTAPKVREIPKVPRPPGVTRAAARREWERLRRRGAR
jgi:hypothetical protein